MSLETLPKPGSHEAVQIGCTCPILDNHRGEGYCGIAGVYVYSSDCPVHVAEESDELEWYGDSEERVEQ